MGKMECFYEGATDQIIIVSYEIFFFLIVFMYCFYFTVVRGYVH